MCFLSERNKNASCWELIVNPTMNEDLGVEGNEEGPLREMTPVHIVWYDRSRTVMMTPLCVAQTCVWKQDMGKQWSNEEDYSLGGLLTYLLNNRGIYLRSPHVFRHRCSQTDSRFNTHWLVGMKCPLCLAVNPFPV